MPCSLPTPRGLFTRFALALMFHGMLLGNSPTGMAAEYESRIWTDKSGKHEIKAKFVDVTDDVVRLERPNGDISRIPLEKLSDADQDYVRQGAQTVQPPAATPPRVQGLQVGDRVEAEHFSKWQLAVVTEIDFEWEQVKVRIEGDGQMEWPMDLDELRDPDTLQQPVLVKPPSPESSLHQIRPNFDDLDRKLADGTPATHTQADPRTEGSGKWRPRAVRLSGKSDFFESPVDFAIAEADPPRAMILHGNHHDESLPRVELVDLKARKVIASGPAPSGTGQLSFSPGGTVAASFPSEIHGPDSTGRVDFWKISGGDISHWVSFVPYIQDAWPNLEPQWFAWLDERRMFTVNREGQLILWQVDGAKALYELRLDRGVQPLLTHGRRQLVVPTTAGVQCFDANSGELQAVLGTGNFLHATLAFSPSGRQLAIAADNFIDVLDVTTGEAKRSFPCSEAGFRDQLWWIDEDYLFVGDGRIVNVPLRITAWKFEIPGELVKPSAGTQWTILENNANESQVLVPFELPPPEALEVVKNLDEAELLVVRPGDAIQIDVQIPNDSLLAQDVRQALAEGLAAANMQVAEDSPLKLVARTTTGETDQVRYRSFHDHFGEGEVIEVTSRVYELELLKAGAVVWKRTSTHAAPHHLQLEDGETIRAAIDRVMKPRGANFNGRLPSYVVRPEYLEPLGTSKLSLQF